MGFWQKLFGAGPEIPELVPRQQVQPAPIAPKPSTPAPGSPEMWAEDLKAKKDYSALAAVVYEDYKDGWWPKVYLAQSILEQAGTDAVQPILQEVAKHGYCRHQLAEVLLDIGDPRAVPVLKQSLEQKEYSHVPVTQSSVEQFVAKFDSLFQEERKLAKAAEEATAQARLIAPAAEGVQLREYSTAYIFAPAAAARRAFEALQAAIRHEKSFPLNAPHQIALVHGPAADFVAVLVRLPTKNDEGVALHRRLSAWFAESGAGSPDDYESLSAPLPGRLSRGLEHSLPDQYSVLELIHKL